MYEQTTKLRQLISKKKSSQTSFESVKVYCVTSGKGGVGKTNLVVNMGLVLQDIGKRVLLIDADLGLANIDIVAGLSPKYNISHILSAGKSIDDVIVKGPRGISILPGASGIYDLANLSNSQLQVLINSFKSVADDFDIIIIDTGAGISKNVISFVQSSDEIIVVTTPEPSAITDAYALIKISHKYCDSIHVVVNKADNYKEADFTVKRLSSAAEKFLNINIDYLGFILEDKNISKSNMTQVPFYIKYPNTLASKCLVNVSRKLISSEKANEKDTTVDGWFAKLISLIKTNLGAM